MSERERWIVYPLLFLALGASLRDKLLQQTTSKTIRCEEMICEQMYCQQMSVVDKQGRPTPLLQGPRLQLESLQANVINANQYLRAGQQAATPGAAGPGFSLQPAQMLELLRRSGLIRMQPPGEDQPPEADSTEPAPAPGPSSG